MTIDIFIFCLTKYWSKINSQIREKFSLLFLTSLSTWLDKARPVHVCVLFPIRRQCGDPLLLISIPPLPAKQSVCFPRERVTRFVITDDECPCHCQKTYPFSIIRFNPRDSRILKIVRSWKRKKKDYPPTHDLINFHVRVVRILHKAPIFALENRFAKGRNEDKYWYVKYWYKNIMIVYWIEISSVSRLLHLSLRPKGETLPRNPWKETKRYFVDRRVSRVDLFPSLLCFHLFLIFLL